MKILMIGNKDPGKTTCMASAYSVIRAGIEGFSVMTDGETDRLYRRLYDRILTGQYPVATDKRSSYSFDLCYKQQPVLHFDWIDYNGGIINTFDADDLMADINDAEGLMLFFDAQALRDDEAKVHQMRRIISLLSRRIAAAQEGLLSILIVVTKADKLRSEAEYWRVVEPLKAFSDSLEDNQHVYARVVPVSCTEKGMRNVDLPLLDILDSGMAMENLNRMITLQETMERASKYNDSRGIVDWMVSRLFGVKTNGELAEEELEKAKAGADELEKLIEPWKKLKAYIREYPLWMPDGL